MTRYRAQRASFVRNWLEDRTSIYDSGDNNFSVDICHQTCSSSSSKKSYKSVYRHKRNDSKNSFTSWYSLEHQVSLLNIQKRKLREKTPLHLSFNILLPLLYLAVLLTKEDILLMDIIRQVTPVFLLIQTNTQHTYFIIAFYSPCVMPCQNIFSFWLEDFLMGHL